MRLLKRFPATYIEWLRTFESQPDPAARRRAENEACRLMTAADARTSRATLEPSQTDYNINPFTLVSSSADITIASRFSSRRLRERVDRREATQDNCGAPVCEAARGSRPFANGASIWHCNPLPGYADCERDTQSS